MLRRTALPVKPHTGSQIMSLPASPMDLHACGQRGSSCIIPLRADRHKPVLSRLSRYSAGVAMYCSGIEGLI
jgi:hypothetical protein